VKLPLHLVPRSRMVELYLHSSIKATSPPVRIFYAVVGNKVIVWNRFSLEKPVLSCSSVPPSMSSLSWKRKFYYRVYNRPFGSFCDPAVFGPHPHARFS
jgi:hypothetical protein